MKIFLSRPNIGEEEIKAVTEVLKTDQLALGPKAELFEKLFASLTNTKYAVAVNSGTSGLHLAVRALDIKDGDEVITTPFSFIASANCMLFEKAIPVFVDVEEETYGMNPDLIEAAITPRTKAILPVHVFGQCCKMDEIEKIAKKHNLKIIEDACESPLATHNNRQAGSFGDCSVFAFYPNKQMTTGEGGMITTNDEALYNLFLSLRNQGRGNSLEWLTHTRLGYNYRISEISAAIGVEQTKKLPRFIEEKRELANKYNFVLGNINGLTTPITGKSNTHSWFVYSVRVNAEKRNEVLKGLNDNGIQSKAYFYPCIHLQEFYINEFGYKAGDYPISEKLSEELIVLPFHHKITNKEITYIESTLNSLINNN